MIVTTIMVVMRAPRPKPLRPRAAAAGLIAALGSFYDALEWALFAEVRSALGMHAEGLRIADALAVYLGLSTALRLHYFEAKAERRDFELELERPEKAEAIARFCTARYIVARAPWTRVVLKLSELPAPWGLIEIDGSARAHVVQHAVERPAREPVPLALVQSLLRKAAEPPRDEAADAAPLVAVVQALSREHVALACGHRARRPLAKVLPLRLPCASCLEGRPPDREVIAAAIEDASPDELCALRRQIEQRAPRRLEVAS
jgi:hypothetical protein